MKALICNDISYNIIFLGMVMSVCSPVRPDNALTGVVCIDLVLEDFLAEIKYNTGEKSYVFIIDEEGRSIYHPRLPLVYTVGDLPTLLNIRALEPNPEVRDVIDSMLR